MRHLKYISKACLFFILIGHCSSPIAWGKPSVKNHEYSNFSVDTAQFLTQATLGWNAHSLGVSSLDYDAWITNQMGIDPTLTAPYIRYINNLPAQEIAKEAALLPFHKVNSAGNHVGYLNFSTAWMRAVLGGDDHLRQRVAWALSQILVVSNRMNILTHASSDYYDMLITGAFGKYEQLLLNVAMHPVMGRYLSHLGNRKANLKTGRYPDENFAREVMQLFTIGLWELNSNGIVKLDSNQKPIPTYTITDVKTIARVFTGLWLDEAPYGKIWWDKFAIPMRAHESRHDSGSKRALQGQIDLPAKQGTLVDIQKTIHVLATHQNTAPFVSRRLINNLVTSNPSPEYINRVVQVWRKSDGLLSEVIRAILLDTEARTPPNDTKYGRLKDPIQRITSILIAYNCGDNLGTEPFAYPGLQWWHPYLEDALPQVPLLAPSVFSFYQPDYKLPGLITKMNLFSPEFQLHNDVTSASIPEYLWTSLQNGFHRPHSSRSSDQSLMCNFKDFAQLALDDQIEYASLTLTAGSLDDTTKQKIKEIATPYSEDKTMQAKLVVYATAISPFSAIQR